MNQDCLKVSLMFEDPDTVIRQALRKLNGAGGHVFASVPYENSYEKGVVLLYNITKNGLGIRALASEQGGINWVNTEQTR